MNDTNYLPHTEEMKEWAKSHGPKIARICDSVLNNSTFDVWTGSTGNKHHYGKCGLSQHTFEVITIASNVNKILNYRVNEAKILLAGLFHDIGKLWDYAPADPNDILMKEWVGTEHKRKIHHITRSALYWQSACEMEPEVWNEHFEDVLHAILSHHGRREWGSPVVPKGRLAYLLHYSDAISARMDDCDRIDLID